MIWKHIYDVGETRVLFDLFSKTQEQCSLKLLDIKKMYKISKMNKRRKIAKYKDICTSTFENHNLKIYISPQKDKYLVDCWRIYFLDKKRNVACKCNRIFYSYIQVRLFTNKLLREIND